MSGSTTFLRSPQQAVNTFSQPGGFPRQRNVFIIRFIPNGGQTNFANLTFAAKSVERPKINPKTEELHQYNKKRQVFTGFKLEPIRVQFFDSADGAAQNMWTQYGRYYFGDINDQTNGLGTGNQSYNYDVTMPTFIDYTNTGFGFTANNGGSTDINAQFFFDRIEIYHFYDGLFDLYYLVHPKITSFEPDDLDYESSGISMISMSLAYENVQYFPQQPINNVEFDEFDSRFFGNPLAVASTGAPNLSTNITQLSSVLPSNPSISALLTPALSANISIGGILNYRFTDPSGGAIGVFGNFVFGPTAAVNNSTNLSTMSLGNPALAAALSVGSNINIMASSTPVLSNTINASSRGISGALYDVVNAKTMSASNGYGNAPTTVTRGLLASQAINGSGVAVNSSGQVTLSPQGYGAINAQQTGTAQYGYNVQTDANGNSWGFTGPRGFLGPTFTPQNPGPYSNDQPSGLYGRFVPPEEIIPPTFGGS